MLKFFITWIYFSLQLQPDGSYERISAGDYAMFDNKDSACRFVRLMQKEVGSTDYGERGIESVRITAYGFNKNTMMWEMDTAANLIAGMNKPGYKWDICGCYKDASVEERIVRAQRQPANKIDNTKVEKSRWH